MSKAKKEKKKRRFPLFSRICVILGILCLAGSVAVTGYWGFKNRGNGSFSEMRSTVVRHARDAAKTVEDFLISRSGEEENTETSTESEDE